MRTDLERQIGEGRIPPGTFLPPERVLLRHYGVSRTTLHEALRPLLLEGTLVSVRGKGIMVAQAAIRQAGDVLMSFTDMLRSQGLQPGMAAVRVAMGRPSREVSAALRLPPGSRVARIERVRTANSQPVNFSVSYLPAQAVPGLSAPMVQAAGSLYLLLQTRYGIRIGAAQDEMWARRASRREAELLGIREGDPVLILRRVCLLHDGRPVEYALSVIRSDIYRYVVKLTPPRPPGVGARP
ncbi:MAG: GntR family transcriptional regulator [Armatimonadota bacterium]|nr:GntR family transcriptional regulator [Armatimonadota bacterium]MDR7402721.1 GntR family transcriptional regulator [Armatimonadota bacterium]MDR7403504.1 GntR family transcriptional regulator [Armatimonadota bacterium]MDR7506483.1 GntR family transcriptional regulator [Armatimonadota bacterium]MDR7509848.1 GntR family transcriptional regulator [Armatimonadota bacterium]